MTELQQSAGTVSGAPERTIRFRILGELRVDVGAGVVELSGARQKSLLIFLLLHARTPLTNDELIEAVWYDKRPAVKGVQMAVSRLRTALGPLGGALRAFQGGYALDVDREDVDVDVFEALTRDGAAALDAKDPARAARLLREADALWRGPALVDVAKAPYARDAIRRLEEERIAAIENRNDADLALGRHADLVPYLEDLVRAWPTRDRLAGQLMLALYRSGRQRDALDVFQRARSRLVSELGLDPSPELHRLQLQILEHDPAIARGAAQLPAELDADEALPLAGRETELAWLRERWDRARALSGSAVAVTGPSGIGKSRLVAELARAVRAEGAIARYVAKRASVGEALSATRDAGAPLLLVVDGADAATITTVAAYHRALAERPVLVVVLADAGTGDLDALALGPLDRDAVASIAREYSQRGEPPAARLLESSGGNPRRVHEEAAAWARAESERRVTLRASETANGRAQLRSLESLLVEDLADRRETSARPAGREEEQPNVVCPFKGLASFDVADAEYFYGRERLVDELLARLVGTSLLGIIGPSGSGKSSVLRAGLLPALADGVLPGREHWTPVVLRPGEHPPQDLAAIVGPGEFVLAVDQFEEVFTACEDPAARAGFISALVELARERRGVVVLALRADQYGRCADHPALSRMLAADQVLVPPLSRDEVRRAIECPASRAGLVVEPALSDVLIADVEEQAGALPLLSTALLELWQHRAGRELTLAAYRGTGGMSGAVARLAERAFDALDADQRPLARELLLSLTAEGADGTVERRRVAREELEIGPAETVGRVLETLADQRLIILSAGRVELSHEALLREWPRLRGWIDEDREGLHVRRGVATSARDWAEADRDEGSLYQGVRLEKALEYRAQHPGSLNALEQEFLTSGAARRDRDRTARRRRRRLGVGAATTALVATIGVGLTLYFAARERDTAASRDLASKSSSLVANDPALAQAVALEALRRRETTQAENAVRQAAFLNRGTASVQAHDALINDLAVSEAAGLAVTSAEDGRVRLWALDRLRERGEIARGKTRAMAAAVSDDGSQVAAAFSDGVIVLKPVAGGPARRLTQLDDDFAVSLEFTPDGRRLLIGTGQGVVGLVGVDDGAVETLTKHDKRTRARLDAAGTRVVTASDDKSAAIVALGGGAPITIPHPEAVIDAAFSPDGKRVATAGTGVVRIWNAADGTPMGEYPVGGGTVMTVAFSPDGRRIVAPGYDGAVRIIDTDGGVVTAALSGHAGVAYDATYIRDGRALVSAGQDGTLRTWAPPAVSALPVANGQEVPVAFAFSPDASHVVAGYSSGALHVFNAGTGQSAILPRHDAWATANYSADGKFIASASYDTKVRLWDVAKRMSRDVPTTEGLKMSVAVSRGGRLIAFDGVEEDPVLQAPDGSGRVVLRGHTGEVPTLVFSPDGKRLLSASEDGTIRIWSTPDGALVRTLRGHDKAIINAAYSRDGQRIASADTNGVVRVWSAESGEQLAALFGHEGTVNSVEFDQSGERLVTAGTDGTIRVWSASGGDQLAVVHRHDGIALNARFSPDGKRVLSEGDEGVLLSYACEVCGPFEETLAVARSRLQRELSAGERQRLAAG